MAKRKSINKRLSRYSQRSSIGSGFLDPNSELLGEEEPFWWNKLSNITDSASAKYNVFNETSKYLHSDSQTLSNSISRQWWKVLQTSDSSQSGKHIEAVRQKIQNEHITSDTDEEEIDLPLRKRKIQIRKKAKRNISNIFKKALDDSSDSESPDSNLPKSPITKDTNDASSSKKSLQGLNLIEKETSPIRNTSNTRSIDQSHISDKILKPKHNIFRKKLKKKSYNAFEHLLNDDTHNKSGETETTSSNSSAKLMYKKNTSKDDILNKSKEEEVKMSSSEATVYKESIANPETLNYNNNNLIHHNRTDSDFSLLSSSNESRNLEIPDLIFDRSHKNVSHTTDVSTNQKNSSIVKENTNLTMHSTTSKKVRDSTTNEEIENREITNKNETSLASMNHIHTPNKSKMESSINIRINNSNVRKTINASQHESTDERNLTARISNNNDKFQTTNMVSRNTINLLSNSKSIENNDFKNKRTASSILSESNNIIKNSTYVRSFTENNSMNITKMGDIISTENRIHTINSNNNSLHTTNAIEDTSKNKTLKRNISTLHKTSIHNISNKNEDNFLKTNNKTPVKDLDTNAQKSLRIDVVDDEQKAEYIDYPNRETSRIINTDQTHQTKINEYFTTTNSKLVSPNNARQSKHNKEIKKKEITKPKINISKLINENTMKDTLLTKREILEKINELQNMKTEKKSEKKKINKAYIINGEVYKKPKLPRPKSWATNRLYQFLWKAMQPKYESLTRVQSEKFVKELSDVVSIITKTKKYKNYETLLKNLMEYMASSGIIRTPNDFYHFCYDYLPYDFRIKVVPMILPGNIRNIPFNPEIVDEPIIKD